jgi:hypothetical protein
LYGDRLNPFLFCFFLLDTGNSLTIGIKNYDLIEFWNRLLVYLFTLFSLLYVIFLFEHSTIRSSPFATYGLISSFLFPEENHHETFYQIVFDTNLSLSSQTLLKGDGSYDSILGLNIQIFWRKLCSSLFIDKLWIPHVLISLNWFYVRLIILCYLIQFPFNPWLKESVFERKIELGVKALKFLNLSPECNVLLNWSCVSRLYCGKSSR